MRPELRRELAKARSWATATAVRLQNAETALKNAVIIGSDGVEVARCRRERDSLVALYHSAHEDAAGWARLARRIR